MNSIDTYNLYVSRVLALLAGICALAVFLYGTFLLIAVGHTAARTTAQEVINHTGVGVTELEVRYLAETKSLTPERAAELGFVTPLGASVSTVFATAATRSLSLK